MKCGVFSPSRHGCFPFFFFFVFFQFIIRLALERWGLAGWLVKEGRGFGLLHVDLFSPFFFIVAVGLADTVLSLAAVSANKIGGVVVG